MEARDQDIGEEIANSVSHGVGAVLAIAGLILLSLRAAATGGVRHVVCCAIFGASAVLLYLSSTLYHSLGRTRAYRVMLSLDHGSIYLLIAGTYTPFTLVGLRGTLGWTLFGIVWAAPWSASSSRPLPRDVGESSQQPCIWQWDGPASSPLSRCIT